MTLLCDTCGTETHPPGQPETAVRGGEGNNFCSPNCKENYGELNG